MLLLQLAVYGTAHPRQKSTIQYRLNLIFLHLVPAEYPYRHVERSETSNRCYTKQILRFTQNDGNGKFTSVFPAPNLTIRSPIVGYV